MRCFVMFISGLYITLNTNRYCRVYVLTHLKNNLRQHSRIQFQISNDDGIYFYIIKGADIQAECFVYYVIQQYSLEFSDIHLTIILRLIRLVLLIVTYRIYAVILRYAAPKSPYKKRTIFFSSNSKSFLIFKKAAAKIYPDSKLNPSKQGLLSQPKQEPINGSWPKINPVAI